MLETAYALLDARRAFAPQDRRRELAILGVQLVVRQGVVRIAAITRSGRHERASVVQRNP